MPLYIRDDDVDALAIEVQRISKARSKTDAVRNALKHEIERINGKIPLHERLAALQIKARELGLPNHGFDMKKYTDEMWGDE